MEAEDKHEKKKAQSHVSSYRNSVALYYLLVRRYSKIKVVQSAPIRLVTERMDSKLFELVTPLVLEPPQTISWKRFCRILIPPIIEMYINELIQDKFIRNTLITEHDIERELEQLLKQIEAIRTRRMTWKRFEERSHRKRWPQYIRAISGIADTELLANVMAGLHLIHKELESLNLEILNFFRKINVLRPLESFWKAKEFMQSMTREEVTLTDIETSIGTKILYPASSSTTVDTSLFSPVISEEEDRIPSSMNVSDLYYPTSQANVDSAPESLEEEKSLSQQQDQGSIAENHDAWIRTRTDEEQETKTLDKYIEYHSPTSPYDDHYKIDVLFLEKIIQNREEGGLWEFKVSLDISTHERKAEFIRDMISLGNKALEDRKKAFLIVGVSTEEDAGRTISPNLADDATYQQIIASYVDPKIDFELRRPIIFETRIVVFVILGKGKRPYSVKRKLQGRHKKIELDVGDSWTRLGSSKKVLTHEELKELGERLAS